MSIIKVLKRILPESLRDHSVLLKNNIVNSYYQILARRLLALNSNEVSAFTFLFSEKPYSPELVMKGYLLGIFPSSYHGDGIITWHDPDERGALPVRDFHIPRNLKRILRQQRFETRVNQDFRAILEGCAENRPKTHINATYMDVYEKLHEMGVAHCVGAWQDGQLVGGTYGLALGGYFVSESAFYRVRDASKVATVRLTEILVAGGFVLHDTWWFSQDIEQYGGYRIPRDLFHKQHSQAIATPARFHPDVPQTLSIGKDPETLAPESSG